VKIEHFVVNARLAGMTATKRNSSAEESSYIRPLSIEAVVALLVAFINLALDQADVHIVAVSWGSMILCIALSLDALRRTDWILSKGKKSREFVISSIVITTVFLGLGWFLSLPKKGSEASSQTNQLGAQIRPTSISYTVPVIGQKPMVTIQYNNFGPSTVKLNLVASITMVDQGEVLSPDGHRYPIAAIDRTQAEVNLWDDFLSRYKKDMESPSNFSVLPPFVNTWSTPQGQVLLPQEGAETNINSGRVAIYLMARFIWKEEESDSLYGYDLCNFITGNPQAVINCSAHNGPIKLH